MDGCALFPSLCPLLFSLSRRPKRKAGETTLAICQCRIIHKFDLHQTSQHPSACAACFQWLFYLSYRKNPYLSVIEYVTDYVTTMPLSCEQAFFHILVFLQVGNIAVSINGMEKSVFCQSGRPRTWYLALPPLPTRLFWSMGKGYSCVSIRYGAAVLSGNIFLGVQNFTLLPGYRMRQPHGKAGQDFLVRADSPIIR